MDSSERYQTRCCLVSFLFQYPLAGLSILIVTMSRSPSKGSFASEETSETQENKVIDLSFENVIGPIQLTQIISDTCIIPMVNHVFEFFITTQQILEAYPNIKSHQLIGHNVYQSNSSLIAVIFHQGIIIPSISSDSAPTFSGFKIVNEFNSSWQVISNRRVEVSFRDINQIAGVTLIVGITPELSRFESFKQYDIKSRSSNKTNAHGFALIYGEPVFSEPVCMDQSALDCLRFAPEPTIDETENRWLRFGISGEPMPIYKLQDFTDFDLPVEQWISQRFKKDSLLFDAGDARYEIVMSSSNKSVVTFRVSRLNQDAPSIAQIKELGGTPVKEDKKVTLQEVGWTDIIFGEDNITIEGEKYGPIYCYSWVKRKRAV